MKHDAPLSPRRITPGTISFYVERARQLRAEAYRSTMLGLWASLVKLVKIIGRR